MLITFGSYRVKWTKHFLVNIIAFSSLFFCLTWTLRIQRVFMTQMFPNIHIKCFFSWYMESFQMVTWTSSQDNLAFPSWIIFCGNSGVWLWWWFPCRLSKCQTPLLTTILFTITLSPDNQATWSNETSICRWEMSPVSVDDRCVEINIHTLYIS